MHLSIPIVALLAGLFIAVALIGLASYFTRGMIDPREADDSNIDDAHQIFERD